MSATPAFISLAWQRVIWEDLIDMVPEWKPYGHNVSDVPRDSDGGYLRRGKTPHKSMHAKYMKFSELKDER